MSPTVKQIAKEYKLQLQQLYGSEFERLILFGSEARGDAHNESDIDFLLVLNKAVIIPSEETFRTATLSTQLELNMGGQLLY